MPGVVGQTPYRLGVGHIKYKIFDEMAEHYPCPSPLTEFTDLLRAKGKQEHPHYIYMFYLYIFSIGGGSESTGDLVLVSPMLMPEEAVSAGGD